MYVYVPNAAAANIMAIIATVADENSLTFGVDVGVVVAVGSVTVLLVGMKKACKPQLFALTLYSIVLLVVVNVPAAVATSQHRKLKPVPGVAVKVLVVPIV